MSGHTPGPWTYFEIGKTVSGQKLHGINGHKGYGIVGESGIYGGIHGEANARETCPDHKDESEGDLQIEQAAKAGREAAVHAFEFSAAQPAKSKLDDCDKGNEHDQPAKVGMYHK